MSMTLDRLSILVVDDNPSASKLLVLVLDELGVGRVVTAESGEQARDILSTESGTIDLVICDKQMPGMSGLDLLAETRAGHPDLPFIMITGNADSGFIEAAEKLGISGYVKKPYSPRQVEEAVHAVAAEL